ncbi:MAG: zf-HC2 domain-containing protein [Pyrinomonadaceae bacterium]
MTYEKQNLINCSQFEESLTDYLDRALDGATHKEVAAHALSCPLCHSLLNDVKGALAVCREISEPRLPVTRLEARILASTIPNSALHCEEFEDYLTDYLDGFLPAQVFHRWERHAVLCDDCTDLPGAVVRSLAAIVSYKLDELPLPAGLHQKILQDTIGTEKAASATASVVDQFKEWIRGFSFPISIPQLAPVAMMLMFAFLVFSQTVSADGSLTDVYAKSYRLAEQTYEQSAAAWNGKEPESQQSQEPITGTTFVEDKK